MGTDRAAVFHHFLDHICGHGVAAAVEVVGVEIDGEWVAEFFEDRVGIGVNGFPAVINGDQNGLIGDGFFPLLPEHEIF